MSVEMSFGELRNRYAEDEIDRALWVCSILDTSIAPPQESLTKPVRVTMLDTLWARWSDDCAVTLKPADELRPEVDTAELVALPLLDRIGAVMRIPIRQMCHCTPGEGSPDMDGLVICIHCGSIMVASTCGQWTDQARAAGLFGIQDSR